LGLGKADWVDIDEKQKDRKKKVRGEGKEGPKVQRPEKPEKQRK
jgi:hypothetical protein